jgi:hypothetical protein
LKSRNLAKFNLKISIKSKHVISIFTISFFRMYMIVKIDRTSSIYLYVWLKGTATCSFCFHTVSFWTKFPSCKYTNKTANKGAYSVPIGMTTACWKTWFRLLYSFHNFFRICNIFGLSTTEETWVVEMRIWSIRIGTVLVLHTVYTRNFCMVKFCGIFIRSNGHHKFLLCENFATQHEVLK